MKRAYAFFTCISFLFLFLNYSAGPPAGRTNSPYDAKSCRAVGCHFDAPFIVNTTSWITTNVPSKGFIKDSTYIITITPNSTTHSVYGFQLTAQDIIGRSIGTLGLINSNDTRYADATTKYVEHTFVGSRATIGTKKSWQISWRAPINSDSATFYACVNVADGSGTNSGDSIYSNTLTIRRAFETPTTDLSPTIKVQVAPNPLSVSANNTVFSFLKSSVRTWNLRLYNMYGALVATHKIEYSGDIQYHLPTYNLSGGLYAFSITDETDVLRASGKLLVSIE